MKIVICTPSQDEIEFFSKALSGNDVVFFDKNLDEDILKKISDCEIFSGRIYSKVNEEVLKNLPRLRFIVTHSTGFDHIDIEACKKRNVAVLNIPSYGERSIAEFVLGMILSLTKNIHKADRQVQDMEFDSSLLDGDDIFGKTIGIVGTGKIGKEVAMLSKAMGMNVIAYDLFEDEQFSRISGIKYVTFDELLSSSDIVSLHVPHMKETHHLMNKVSFSLMKQGSYLINTARGGVVETESLVNALKSGKIKGAALDVIEYEKVLFSKEERLEAVEKAFKELRKYNVLYTPHMAAHSTEAQQKKLEIISQNILSCANGSPTNIVKLS